MTQAQSGDSVQVHYVGTFDDGEKFDSSRDDDDGPLEIELGNQEVIPGFDAAVIGMAVGETKTVRIPCADAYGPLSDEIIFPVPRADLPGDFEPRIGAALMMADEEEDGSEGEPVQVIVVSFDDESVTLDANHPLAGRDLNFDLELVAIL